MARSCFLFLFVLTAFCSSAQTAVIAQLKGSIRESPDDRRRLESILLLCEQRQSLSTDTLYHYARAARNLSLALKDPVGLLLSDYDIAFCLARKEQLDSSLGIINRVLDRLRPRAEQRDLYTKFALLKARVLDRSNDYLAALAQLHEVLRSAEEGQDTLSQVMAYTGIGWVQLELGKHREALSWFYRALHATRNPNYLREYSALYSNMATTYHALHRNDSAEYFIRKAITNARESGTLTFLATSLNIQADIFIRTGREAQAEAALHEAVRIRRLIDDPYYIVYDMSRLAQFYAHNGQPEKGILLCSTGIDIARKSGLTSQLQLIYEALAAGHKAAGHHRAYGQTLEELIVLKDSLYNINSTRLLADLRGKYDLQKKETVIIQQRLDLVKQNYRFYGLLLLLLFLLSFAGMLFRRYRQKQRRKMEHLLQEEKRLSAQAITEAEEAERKRIAADLHDNLGAYAASIASNLDHIAGHTTDPGTAVALQELRSNAQSIVALLSDTIWALKKDALSLTAISDRLKIFIQRIQPSYPDTQVDVLERIAVDHLLPPSQAFHLFQIVQEAINNALRHSGSPEITVVIESDRQWRISINDEGKGLSGRTSIAGGNGLANMRARAREAGWAIEWQQNRTRGTSVLIVPTTN